jgi:hypothetical protein
LLLGTLPLRELARAARACRELAERVRVRREATRTLKLPAGASRRH